MMSRSPARSCCPALRALALGGLLLVSGCTPRWFVEDADEDANELLGEFQHRSLADRSDRVIHPDPMSTEEQDEIERTFNLAAEDTATLEDNDLDAAESPAGSADADGAPEDPPGEPTSPGDSLGSLAEELVIRIDLAEALRRAVHHNREYKSRTENLYLDALSYSLTRFNFGPQLNSALSYVINVGENQRQSSNLDADISISQILPTGGSLSLGSAIGTSRVEGPQNFPGEHRSYQSSVGLNFAQPLLRGFGYEISHEALTQAERGFVYDIRNFELFREDFSIQIAERFFGLVSQKKQLSNDERDYDEAVFDRKKSEALYSVDRLKEEDVFQTRRRELDTKNRVIEARTTYRRAVDRFKIDLGIPTDTPIEIVEEEPPFEAIRLDADSAVQATMHNRLDLQTARDQLEDVERGLRIAENGLLPDVDLTAGYNWSGSTFGPPKAAAPDHWTGSAGVRVEIPLQREPERNSYRAALIAFERSRRDFDLLLENVEQDLRDELRRLQQSEQQIELQLLQIEQEKRAVAPLEIRVASGDASARDLLEARQALINAQNQLIDLKASHFIQRLRLLRNLGTLFIDENGMWQ